MWDYRAQLVRILDGDTISLLIDQGFSSRQEEHIRLLDVSAPELSQPGGLDAREYVERWMAVLDPQRRWPLLVRTQPNTNPEPTERRSLVRYLGHVYDAGQPDRCLNVDVGSWLSLHPEWGTGS